jgi:hypothetical protein
MWINPDGGYIPFIRYARSIFTSPMQRQELLEMDNDGLREADDAAYLELHPDGRAPREPTTWGERCWGLLVSVPFLAGAVVVIVLYASKIGMFAVLAGLLVAALGVHVGRVTASDMGRRRLRRQANTAVQRGFVSK